MKLVSRLGVAALALMFAIAGGLPARADNVVEVAADAGTFNTLIAAAKAAGLADALATTSPITVFAPTDAAFRKLPKGTVEKLLEPENRDKLRAILSYHVLPAQVLAKDVPHKPTRVATLNADAKVRVSRAGKRVHVDNARVIKADIRADNGVIHVIDQVLIPGKRH